MTHASFVTGDGSDRLRSLLRDLESIALLQRLEGVSGADLARIERNYRQLVEAIESVSLAQAPSRKTRRRYASLPRASSMLARSTPPAIAKIEAEEFKPRLQPPRPERRRTFSLPTAAATPTAHQPEETPSVSEDSKPTPAPALPVSQSLNDSTESKPPAAFVAPWKQKAPAEDETMPDLRIGGRKALSAQPRESGEWTIRIRWWNAPLAAAVSLAVVVGLLGISVESARLEWTRTQLTSELRNPEPDDAKARKLTSELLASPLGRFDADRDYLAAVATWRMSNVEDVAVKETIARFLRRSVQKAPASPWHQISLAAMSSSEFLPSNLPTLKRIAWNEPDALAALAPILNRSNFADKAQDCLARLLVLDPARTAEVVAQCLDQHIPFEEALEIVPADIVAVAEVTKLAKPWNENQLRRWVEVQLTQIANPAPNAPTAIDSAEAAMTAEASAWDRVQNWLRRVKEVPETLRPEALKAN